jgi:hypothetical protein
MCPVPFIDCEENNELSDLFDVCFLDNGLHFLNGHLWSRAECAAPKETPSRAAFASQSSPLPPSPPAEKATARR